jgi:hypothetical protein
MALSKNFKSRLHFLIILGSLALIADPVTPIPCTNIFPKVFGADEAYDTGSI